MRPVSATARRSKVKSSAVVTPGLSTMTSLPRRIAGIASWARSRGMAPMTTKSGAESFSSACRSRAAWAPSKPRPGHRNAGDQGGRPRSVPYPSLSSDLPDARSRAVPLGSITRAHSCCCFVGHVRRTARLIIPGVDEDKPRVEIGRTLDRVHPMSVHVGVFTFRNARKWRTAIETRSFGSFHGKNVIWAFGASVAVSSATAYGCDSVSSGMTRTGVVH